ncbi:hypothetical protein P0Y43_26165 [Pseudomonas entomophila]|uniref:hypothetical protein n=1 Tax=Pseudomonas entomophila TaxID=312306 RepID=UPI0023D85848|nr:hypothetical protein [Pseudomonas entomophila]MDF0734174.1 hypothetical protein [Pseudomonas entomophila]
MNINQIDHNELVVAIAGVVSDQVFKVDTGERSARDHVERSELVAVIMGHITAALWNLDPDLQPITAEQAVVRMRQNLMPLLREFIKPVEVGK